MNVNHKTEALSIYDSYGRRPSVICHSHFNMENYYRIVEAILEANSAKMEASVASNYT